MNPLLVKVKAVTNQRFLNTGVNMRFETTRRRFIALLSFLMASRQMKSGALAQTSPSASPGLKPGAGVALHSLPGFALYIYQWFSGISGI
jgi:hypothetical protein